MLRSCSSDPPSQRKRRSRKPVVVLPHEDLRKSAEKLRARTRLNPVVHDTRGNAMSITSEALGNPLIERSDGLRKWLRLMNELLKKIARIPILPHVPILPMAPMEFHIEVAMLRVVRVNRYTQRVLAESMSHSEASTEACDSTELLSDSEQEG